MTQATTGVTGTVYLLHFDRPYKHARHYIGWADDLDKRLAVHGTRHGARLLQVLRAEGIGWTLARTWPGDRYRERQIKTQGGASRACPLCGVTPRTPNGDQLTMFTPDAITIAAPARIERDQYGRYLLPDPATGGHRAWTRATTFAKTLSDVTGLHKWECRMVAKGITLRPDLYALAAAAPAEDVTALDELTQAAKEAASASAAANLGTALHRFTERHDRGELIAPPDPWAADLAAYAATIRAKGITIDPAHIERITPVPELDAAGTLDRIVKVPGHGLVIADVKTGQDLRYSWGEIAIQLAIYAHGAGLWNGTGYDPMPPVSLERALVIHLPAGQARCELHWLDIAAGWEAARLAATVRAWRARRDLTQPHAAAGAAA
jgi:predicted GIY-YIG superfamily endonuclease